MIWNIIDCRRRPYRWKRINAIVEDVAHDNSCEDSDQAAEGDIDSVTYDRREGVSLAEAVAWADGMAGAVTLYLYDESAGTISVKEGEIPHSEHFAGGIDFEMPSRS